MPLLWSRLQNWDPAQRLQAAFVWGKLQPFHNLHWRSKEEKQRDRRAQNRDPKFEERLWQRDAMDVCRNEQYEGWIQENA